MAANVNQATAAQKKEAFIKAYKMTMELQGKLSDLVDEVFGEWDGFCTKVGAPSESEVEHIVIDRLIQPLQEYFKTRTFEEVESEMYSEPQQ